MVGIDDINIYVTPVELTTEEIQRNRGLTDRAIQNAGFVSRSIVPCYEDTLTQAVNAAKSIIKGKENDYKLLIVGTESGFDYGKPISTYAHKYLGLPTACSNFEIKHACYSGTAALKMACLWAQQQESDKKALVLMSDVGRPTFGNASEVTIGSGAVAISVSKNPRILSLNLNSGCASNEVFDVARPTSSCEHMDANLSLSSYLDLVELAWDDFNSIHNINDIQSYFSYMIFHSPLLSLVRQAHSAIMQQSTNLSAADIEHDFEKRVLPTFRFNTYTSNILSSSIYASILGLLTDLKQKEDDLRPISIFSYGSGACAEFFEAKIMKGAHALIKEKNLDLLFNDRHAIDLPTYENVIKEQYVRDTNQDYTPNFDQIDDEIYRKYYLKKEKLVLDKIDNFHRVYKYS